jgi:DNA-binding NarL/FixJ family response regulator
MMDIDSGEPEAGGFDAAQRRTLETLERTAHVFRSIAQNVRKTGDLKRAAQLERLADSADQRSRNTQADAPPPPTRVLLVDDHELAREALRSVLTPVQGYAVVGEAADGQTALRVARQVRPELVLMDLRMPGLDGLATTRALLAEMPDTRVVVLTSFEQRALVLDAIRAGAAGYLLKGASRQEVLETVAAVLGGERRVQGSLAADLLGEEAHGGPSPGLLPPLTERELEVVRLMAAGRTNAEIAQALQISLNTVKTHVLHLFRKLDAPDRAAAVARAAALGLLGVARSGEG